MLYLFIAGFFAGFIVGYVLGAFHCLCAVCKAWREMRKRGTEPTP